MATKSRSDATKGSRVGGFAVNVLERGGVPIFMVALILLFSLLPMTSNVFMSPANLHNIVANQSVVGIIAVAMVIPLVAGYFDLSVPAIAGVANVAMATIVATYQLPIIVGILGGLFLSVLLGLINGWLVAYLKLSPFIATLGTYVLLSGLLVLFTKGLVIIEGMPPGLGQWGAGQWFGIARPFWFLMIVAILAWFLLAQTPFGRKLSAIGSNERAAKLAGIRVERAIFISYAISGLLGGVAGIMLTIRQGSADSSSAISYLFPAMAALFLGQTAIKPGFPNVWGTVFGVFLVAVAVNGLSLLGAQGWASSVFNGAALLIAVAVSTSMTRLRDRKARAEQYAEVLGGGAASQKAVPAA